MSVTQLNIDVKIAGAEEAAAKLQKVEQAADATGKKAEQAGGLFAGFERGVKKLDDAVDAVEKPMRVFNGALDIASIALGVGLAGPLGMVIQQIRPDHKAQVLVQVCPRNRRRLLFSRHRCKSQRRELAWGW